MGAVENSVSHLSSRQRDKIAYWHYTYTRTVDETGQSGQSGHITAGNIMNRDYRVHGNTTKH